jgi:hypothetical protein
MRAETYIGISKQVWNKIAEENVNNETGTTSPATATASPGQPIVEVGE